LGGMLDMSRPSIWTEPLGTDIMRRRTARSDDLPLELID
jgi:hypothetical protein